VYGSHVWAKKGSRWGILAEANSEKPSGFVRHLAAVNTSWVENVNSIYRREMKSRTTSNSIKNVILRISNRICRSSYRFTVGSIGWYTLQWLDGVQQCSCQKICGRKRFVFLGWAQRGFSGAAGVKSQSWTASFRIDSQGRRLIKISRSDLKPPLYINNGHTGQLFAVLLQPKMLKLSGSAYLWFSSLKK